MTAVISQRKQEILKALIECYIQDGQPVGSRKLVEEAGLSVSPATVRNVMADLETHGLIAAPHTSAGRIPTAQGYRMFVDSLISVEAVDDNYVSSLRDALDPDCQSDELVQRASSLLSQLTAQAGIVTVPQEDAKTLRHVEFLPLSGNRVLVILVLNEQDVENRIIHTDQPYSAAQLQFAAAYINERFSGIALEEMQVRLRSAMQADKDEINLLMQAMIDITASGEPAADCVVAGQNNLLNSVDPSGVEQLKGLFDAFQRKKDILELMQHCVQADGIQIFIGQESGYGPFEDYSLVTAPYQRGVQTVGVLGIIGPTRMSYDKVIPVVDVTAKMLSAALSYNK
jgi:heat-inducible transcriptional repressor